MPPAARTGVGRLGLRVGVERLARYITLEDHPFHQHHLFAGQIQATRPIIAVRDELINQQQASELALVRSQVNPHFLFNTLNNIYSLVYRKSDEAPGAVMKLSSIMRYMMYDSSSQKVPLEKEIEYLKSYIELQNLRTKYPDFVSLKIEGITEDQMIAPMLLISFVENAFKHGSKKNRPGIFLHLSTLNGKINFEVINYLKKAVSSDADPIGGIGLNMIRRRLELIYPGKHKLAISQDEETFRINLEIKN